MDVVYIYKLTRFGYISRLKPVKFKNKNLHLIVSICIIFPVAIVYGIMPDNLLTEIYQFKVDSINLSNIFRALMGLYIAMSVFWLIGIIKPHFWLAATLSNVLFMGGLAAGRIISLIADGTPSLVFSLGLIIEVLLMIWGLANLKKYNS